MLIIYFKKAMFVTNPVNKKIKTLEELKRERKDKVEKLSNFPNVAKLKKIFYLLKYSIPLRKIVGYAFSLTVKSPLKKIKASLGSDKIKKESFGDSGKCYISFNLSYAGIGDAIVALRTLNDFAGAADGRLVVDVFFNSPKTLEFIALPQPCVRRVIGLPDYGILKNFYDLNLRLNTFFISENISKSGRVKIESKFPALIGILENIKKSRQGIEKYIKIRPFSEGILADAVVESGQSRKTFLRQAMGMNKNKPIQPTLQTPTSNLLPIDTDPSSMEKFGLKEKKYITIHDGWDENTSVKGTISTKSYPPAKWTALVEQLKSNFPDYLTVQLGGAGNGSDINNADLNLRGGTTLKEAASIIAGSALHIDTDSGLVHIAASLGITSVVLFGPTNMEYCAYDENLNISSGVCGNCWCVTDDWMSCCPLTQNTTTEPSPCMNAIEPDVIIEAIKANCALC